MQLANQVNHINILNLFYYGWAYYGYLNVKYKFGIQNLLVSTELTRYLQGTKIFQNFISFVYPLWAWKL